MLTYKKTLIASFLILCGCLGLGRFGFGMVLPNIQDSLLLTTTQIGFISSANFWGYIVGIIFVNRIYSNFATHKLIFSSLILQGLFMMLMTFFDNYLLLASLYSFSGFFMAIVNMSLMAYMATVIPKNIRGKALGIAVGGSGLAIVSSGFLVPFIENSVTDMPWKTSWMIFSFLVIVTAFVSQPGIKTHTAHNVKSTPSKIREFFKIVDFWKIATLYIIFGFSYIIYVTFFVSSILFKYNILSSISGEVWALLGFCSIFSGFIFGLLADKFGAYTSLISVFFLQGCAHLILALPVSVDFIWFSAILFGITVWSIPALVTLLTSLYFDVKKTAQVLALVTLIFSVAQALGPIVAGLIKDNTNSFDGVFYLTAFLCFFAMYSSYLFSKQAKP